MKNLLSSRGLSVLALSLSVVMVGCGGDASAPVDETPAPLVEESTAPVTEELATEAPATPEVAVVEEAPAEVVAVAAVAGTVAGTVTGTVTLTGTPPVMLPIANINDAKCHAEHGDEPLTSDRVLCGPEGGLKNVFISITNPPAGEHPVPEAPAILDQVGCMYTPHVSGVQVGQTLEIHNSDPTMHNVHRIARANGGSNRMQLAGMKPLSQIFTKAEERMRFKCDVHPWMNAFVFVSEHPFFSVTDENGGFTIVGLPAGNYDVKAWHELYKELTGTVTVDAQGSGVVNFTYEADEE